MGRTETLVYALAALVMVALAVPWFLWRSATVVAGLPVWLWWHIGWLCLTALAFYAFTRTAWGVGVESTDVGVESSTEVSVDE